MTRAVRHVVLTLACATGFCAAAAGQPAAPAGDAPGPAALNPQTATLALTVGRTTVWTTRDLVEATRKKRAVSFTTRYWLQDVGGDAGDAAPRLAYEMTSTGRADALTTFPDGTLLLRFYSTLIWAEPGKDPVEEQLRMGDHEASVLAAWPDGVILQERDLNTDKPVYFAPIVGRGPGNVDLEAKVRITDEAGLRVGGQEFVRAGDRIAWLPAGAAPGVVPPGFKSVLHVYDLGDRRRTEVPLKHPAGREIRAFDGRRALLINHLVDVDTGAENPAPRLDLDVVALRGGHVYHMTARADRYVLQAIPLDDPATPRELLSVPAYPLAGMPPTRPVARNPGAEAAVPHRSPDRLNDAAVALEKAIRVWTGTDWSEVAYLDAPPTAE